jgi:hypothetical protein
MRGQGVATPLWEEEVLARIPGVFHLDFFESRVSRETIPREGI